MAKKRTNDLDLTALEIELGLSSQDDEQRADILERKWDELNQGIDNKLQEFKEVEDPREYIEKVAREGVDQSIQFLEYIKNEIKNGSRSSMMFQSSSNLITSISQTIEKLNGLILGKEKSDREKMRLKLKVMELKIQQQKLEITKRKAQIQARQSGDHNGVQIQGSNVVVVSNREQALKEAEDMFDDIDIDDKDIIAIEGEVEEIE